MFTDFTVTSIETITGFDITTGNYLFTIDELQSASIAQSQEKVDITGKQGRKLSSLKRNKAVTISGTNGFMSGGLLEQQTGDTFTTENEAEVLWIDYLTVESNAATTSYKAVGTTGAEIKELYIKNADGTLGESLTQASTASSGKFAYAPASKALTFSGVTDGTEIVVYYERKIAASVMTNHSDHYSKACVLYIDFLAEDKCGNIYRGQFYVPKADFNGEFTLDFGDNQSVHNFEAEAMAGACGAGGALWTFTVFGVNAEDAA